MRTSFQVRQRIPLRREVVSIMNATRECIHLCPGWSAGYGALMCCDQGSERRVLFSVSRPSGSTATFGRPPDPTIRIPDANVLLTPSPIDHDARRDRSRWMADPDMLCTRLLRQSAMCLSLRNGVLMSVIGMSRRSVPSGCSLFSSPFFPDDTSRRLRRITSLKAVISASQRSLKKSRSTSALYASITCVASALYRCAMG